MHGTHRATRQEYAIKVLDKGHLKRNNKLNTALAEKNTLVRLGSGHPGIVRLHWAFQDDWSLCESASSALTQLCRGGDHHTTVGY
jgi:3-phosphoinositide dependent protein kinase-1